MMSQQAETSFRIEEHGEVPLPELLFATAGMAPFALGAAAVWLAPRDVAATAQWLTIAWGGAILSFLAGVRRGLSFRTPGGETIAQLVTMTGIFVLAIASLVCPAHVALGSLLIGYGALAVLDPSAARKREAPLFFARLRPVQMLVPVVSLAAILAATLLRP